eukprot:7234529-Prymnesium_polylepis.2
MGLADALLHCKAFDCGARAVCPELVLTDGGPRRAAVRAAREVAGHDKVVHVAKGRQRKREEHDEPERPQEQKLREGCAVGRFVLLSV